MKRIVNTKTLPVITVLCAILGMGLRLWTRGGGPDEGGLYPDQPVAWLLLWAVTLGTAVLIWLTVRKLKTSCVYRDNFPASPVAAVMTLPAVIAWVIVSVGVLRSTVMEPALNIIRMLNGILGLAAAVCLGVTALLRAVGKKPFFLLNAVVCIALAVRLFSCCQQWSNLPQLSAVVVPFLASVVLMLASYYRIGFDVDMGNRPMAALFGLMSVYLCLVAMLSFQQVGFYGTCALWQLSGLVSLRPLKRRRTEASARTAAAEEETVSVQQELEASAEEVTADHADISGVSEDASSDAPETEV